MRNKTIQMIIKVLSILGLIASIFICVYGYKIGIFSSIDKLQEFIAGFGLAGAVIFILFQAAQVVIPVMPGGISCLAGVVLFGAWKGFLYNYIGICIGSILAFLLAKYFGRQILECFFRRRMIEKYEKWTSEKGRFTKLFAIAIFLPVAPDDLLCYLAGTTKMRFTHFTGIILLGKPLAIAMYSMGLMAVFTRIPVLIGG